MSDLNPPARKRGRLIVIAVAGAVLAALTAIGITGLIMGPPQTTAPAPGHSAAPPDAAGADETPGTVRLPVTGDPIRYASAVAEALFAWDTADGLTPDGYRTALHTAATTESEESNGLYHDIANYLPDADAWAQLLQMQARQWLEIASAEIPGRWADAADHPWAGEHTVAVTVDGTRHREGVWGGKATATASPVAFTVFLSCPPGEGCKLLRLTLPDAPLR
ncbi:MAG: hypothetical protein J0G30_00245 [Actinomycetales bacterium]|nr:hypothetical protein [Actinomycetales bacterium]